MPVRFGLLGCWHPHADGMVRRIAEHPAEFSLVAAFESDTHVAAQRKAAWSSRVPGVHWEPTAEAVLRHNLDAVLVEGRVFENVSLAMQAVEAGLPVLLEKPAGVDRRGFEELQTRSRERGLHVQMAYLFRSMSAVQELFRRVKGGELGQVYEFRGRLPKPFHEYDDLVRDLGGYAGGVFFEMAGHLIDFLVTILGPPQRIARSLAHHHPAKGRFVDNGAALFECRSGLGIVEVPALEVAPSSRRIEVYGTEGALVIPHLGSGHLANDATQPIEIARRGEPGWERIEIPAATLQIADLREFCAVIAGKKAPDYSREHDLAVHAALIEASGMGAE